MIKIDVSEIIANLNGILIMVVLYVVSISVAVIFAGGAYMVILRVFSGTVCR